MLGLRARLVPVGLLTLVVQLGGVAAALPAISRLECAEPARPEHRVCPLASGRDLPEGHACREAHADGACPMHRPDGGASMCSCALHVPIGAPDAILLSLLGAASVLPEATPAAGSLVPLGLIAGDRVADSGCLPPPLAPPPRT